MDSATIERLIRISHDKPLNPETYIPWSEKMQEHERVLPVHMISVQGLPEYGQLTKKQIDEIARHEVVQFMYSYTWGEAILVAFLGRQIVNYKPESPAYRYMLCEIIEESRHQEMFIKGIQQLDGDPIPPSRQHSFWGKLSCRYFPRPWMFMVSISAELISDDYGREVQADKNVYAVLRKMAELHQIEEGRHIHFTKTYLEDCTNNAGFFKRTIYSLIIALNIHFMRTMYVKKEIFERAGVPDAKRVYKLAKKHYRDKFSKYCLRSAVTFTKDFNGFNWITRPFWNWLLNAEIK